MLPRNAPKFFLTFLLTILLAMPLLTLTRSTAASPDQFFGAIYTSKGDGTAVNANLFDQKSDVYLNGGPQNCNSNGLPDGDYYFQVTDPSGQTLLSTDPASCRQLTVSGGIVVGYAAAAGACHHANGIANIANCGSIPVQLIPFDDTPNMGGEYKVHLIRQTSDTTVDENDPRVIHYNQNDSKSDNFKVRETPPPPPQSAIGGVKYYDTNHNGMLDPGEAGIEGVQIKITLGDGSMTTTTTDKTGTWALSFPVGATYTVCEVLPANTLYTQTGPKSGATASDLNGDPAATANAGMCWVGTVTGHDTSTLNFFNVICTPEIHCPLDIETCNDATKCSAVVNYSVPTATDNCGGTPTVACSPTPGSVFPKGTTTVTCTATGANPNNTASCSFNVTVKDCEAPQISCPQNITRCNDAGSCAAAVTFSATASDNCDGPLTPTCTPASGSSFAVGTTTVTCRVSDAAGNPASCSFTVTVNDCTTGTISGKKFYDANANGRDDDGQVVSGWKVVLSGSMSATAYTNSQGIYSFGPLPAGTYTVAEVSPNGSWVVSSGAPCTFTISCANTSNAFTCNFGNYCKVASGGLTLGFWSNKNGQALTTASDLCNLTSLHLRNGNGSDFDPVASAACPNLTTQQVNSGKTALSNWLTSANASNMANMLSAQMAAMVQNVRHGNVDGNAFDLCSGMTINQLLAAAEASLTANPNTTASGPIRTYQEGLKTCLDRLNNNGLVVKASPCPFTSPY